jgi:hypothetical protein
MSQQPQKRKDAEASAMNDAVPGPETAVKAAFDTSKSREDLSSKPEAVKAYKNKFENGFVDGPDGSGSVGSAQTDARRDSNLAQKLNPAQIDQSSDAQ